MQRPVLRAGDRVVSAGEDEIFLISETHSLKLRGAIYSHLIRLLDGQHSPDALADMLHPEFPRSHVYYALMQLEECEAIVDATAGADRASAAFLHRLKPCTTPPPDRRKAMVSVRNLFDIDVESVRRVLERSGLTVSESAEIVMAITDDPLRPELEDINLHALRGGNPWLLTKPVGDLIWVGPLFVPGHSGCWRCLASRLGTSSVSTQESLDEDGPALVCTAAHAPDMAWVELALSLGANYLLGWMNGSSSKIVGKVLTIDLLRRRTRIHALRSRPQCAACGDPAQGARRAWEPIMLRAPAKRGTLRAGKVRSRNAARFLKRHADLLDPLFGITQDMRRSTKAGEVLPCFRASYRGGPRPRGLAWRLPKVASGKGLFEDDAKAAVLGEAIERYCGIYDGSETVIRGSATQLGDRAIHPNRCMLYSERQYADRERWNESDNPFAHVPRPFSPTEDMDWTPVWSLTRGERRLLPASYLYYEHPEATADSPCWADSNGCAAGATAEDAILGGLLELIERDAVCIWWYNRCRRPGVEMSGVMEPLFSRLSEQYAKAGREFWALDLTTDLGIPTFAAITRRVQSSDQQVLMGFGAHLDAKVALTRALSEMNQVVTTLRGFGNDLTSLSEVGRSWLSSATVKNQPYLLPGPQPPSRLRDLVKERREGGRANVLWCQRVLESRGFEVLALDQSRSDVGVPVFRVIVPGLRHFWARFGPGRLYDVPVSMGWRRCPLAEDQLNPVAVFF